mmetsp:Transcript_13764/g.21686  ORF Transcript_13764/g.21686 Transcript_13764/m.21686 type:complete len:363 (-) Transcript_13764:234-1322(-)
MLETHTTVNFCVSADADARISKLCFDKAPSLGIQPFKLDNSENAPSLDIQSLGFDRCGVISLLVAVLLVALIGTDMAIFNCQLGVLHFSGGSRAHLSALCCLCNIVAHDTVTLSISPSRNAVYFWCKNAAIWKSRFENDSVLEARVASSRSCCTTDLICDANARIGLSASIVNARIDFAVSIVNARIDSCTFIANSRIGFSAWTSNARIDAFVSIANARIDSFASFANARIDFFKSNLLPKPASAEASLSTQSTPAEVNLVVTKMSGMARLTILLLMLISMVSKSLSGVPVEYCFALYGGSRFISERGGISNLDSHHFEVMIFGSGGFRGGFENQQGDDPTITMQFENDDLILECWRRSVSS